MDQESLFSLKYECVNLLYAHLPLWNKIAGELAEAMKQPYELLNTRSPNYQAYAMAAVQLSTDISRWRDESQALPDVSSLFDILADFMNKIIDLAVMLSIKKPIKDEQYSALIRACQVCFSKSVPGGSVEILSAGTTEKKLVVAEKEEKTTADQLVDVMEAELVDDGQPLRCTECPATYINLGGLNRHIRIKHKSYQGKTRSEAMIKPKFQCPLCTKKYSYKKCLQQHLKNNHQYEKPKSSPSREVKIVKIVETRQKAGNIQFRVVWDDPFRPDSWEPISNLMEDDDNKGVVYNEVLSKYLSDHPILKEELREKAL